MTSSKALRRQEYILTLLEMHREVSATELSRRLNVSPWTIRRDLTSLEEQGALKRHYGGAKGGPDERTSSPAEARDSFRVSSDQNLEDKHRIALTAYRLVRMGERLAIGGGTTTLEVAKVLKQSHFHGEIVTNSLDVALELAEEQEIHLTCTGGDVQPRYHTLVGSVAERTLKLQFFDVAFIGISGISPQHGITVNSQVDAAYLELMIEHSRRAVIVADRSKFGRVGFVSLTPGIPVTHFVTNDTISNEYRDYLDALKIEPVLSG
jgi:DeoR family transcriptional regulator, fructose operon transcriptional repressor